MYGFLIGWGVFWFLLWLLVFVAGWSSVHTDPESHAVGAGVIGAVISVLFLMAVLIGHAVS